MSALACPEWCLTSASEHADDDPGRLAHDGPTLGDGSFMIQQFGGDAPTAYLSQREGSMTISELRELAAECIAAAEWLEARA